MLIHSRHHLMLKIAQMDILSDENVCNKMYETDENVCNSFPFPNTNSTKDNNYYVDTLSSKIEVHSRYNLL